MLRLADMARSLLLDPRPYLGGEWVFQLFLEVGDQTDRPRQTCHGISSSLPMAPIAPVALTGSCRPRAAVASAPIASTSST